MIKTDNLATLPVTQANDRIIAPTKTNAEETIERALRPQSLDEYIGQTKAKEQLQIFIQTRKNRRWHHVWPHHHRQNPCRCVSTQTRPTPRHCARGRTTKSIMAWSHPTHPLHHRTHRQSRISKSCIFTLFSQYFWWKRPR